MPLTLCAGFTATYVIFTGCEHADKYHLEAFTGTLHLKRHLKHKIEQSETCTTR